MGDGYGQGESAVSVTDLHIRVAAFGFVSPGVQPVLPGLPPFFPGDFALADLFP